MSATRRVRNVVVAVVIALVATALPPATSIYVAAAQTRQDVEQRDQLIANQEALLNVYRCRFNIDTQVVPGGCQNGAPAQPAGTPQPFTGTPTTQEISVRDGLIQSQEALLNVYRCRFNIDTHIVPGGCPDEGPAQPQEPEPDGIQPPSPTDRQVLAQQSVGPAGAVVSHGAVSVSVPAGAFDGKVQVAIHAPLGEFAGQLGGEVVSVEHQGPLRSSITVTWDVSHLSNSQMETLSLVRWDEGLADWIPGKADFDIAQGILTAEIQQWSSWTWQTRSSTTEYNSLAVSPAHSCAIRTGGTVACWGRNDDGQSNAPNGTFTSVDVDGRNSCAIRSDRSIQCWGDNQSGQLNVPNGSFIQVAVGGWHACGIRSDRTIDCWGDSAWGKTNAPSGEFKELVSDAFHSCGIRIDGRIKCWGWNEYGRTDAPAGTFIAVAVGGWHSCGIRTDGTVVCWGRNEWGQTNAPRGRFRSITAGHWATCGIKTDRSVACWGNEGQGRTGVGVVPTGAFTVVDIETDHSCGIRTDRTVACWGENYDGQAESPSGRFSALGVGFTHSCGLRTDNVIVCWGSNYEGQLEVPGGQQDESPTVPDNPADLWVAGVADDRLTVRWEPPLDDGGSPVTGYVVLIDGPGVAGRAVDVGPSQRSYGFENLLPETQYTVWVAAENAAGVGHEAELKAWTERWCPSRGKFELRRVGGFLGLARQWRIYALEEFKAADPDYIGGTVVIREGDEGGVVFDEDSLWHDGCAWIFGDAAVEGGSAVVAENAVLAGTARLKDHTTITGNAVVRGSAVVSGTASVYDNARVNDATVTGSAAVYEDAVVDGNGVLVDDDARVFGMARILTDARVYGHAKVSGNAEVSGQAKVYGDDSRWSRVHGNAVVQGDAKVYGYAQVYGEAVVEGDAEVYGNAKVFGNALVKGDAKVAGRVEVLGDALLAEPLKNGNVYDGSDCSFGTAVCRYDGTQEYKRAADEVRDVLVGELEEVLYDCAVWTARQLNQTLDDAELQTLREKANDDAEILVKQPNHNYYGTIEANIWACRYVSSAISIANMLTEGLTAMLVYAALDAIEGGALAVSPYAYAIVNLGRSFIDAATIADSAQAVKDLIDSDAIVNKILKAHSLEESLKQINEQTHRNS